MPAPNRVRPAPELLMLQREYRGRRADARSNEVRPVPSKQQMVKERTAIGCEADDLTIKDRIHRAHGVRPVAADVRERTKAVVVFQLEHPIRMIERLRNPDER